MADQDALIRAFADYALTISRPYEIGDVLFRLTDHVVEVLDIDSAGVSLADDGHLGFVTGTDDRAVAVEEQQVDVAEGPCYDAHRSGDTVTSADLTAEDRWAQYTRIALQQGCYSVAGIPLRAGNTPMGALNLYRYRPAEWTAGDLGIARVLSDMAAGYIVNARTLSASQLLASQLQQALHSRIIIEQAKGILAERTGQTVGEAFNTMRAFARNGGHKLHDVAHDIVHRGRSS